MVNKYDVVVEKLKKYNQEHILNWYNELDEYTQQTLLDKILDIDFELLNNIYRNKDKKVDMDNNVIEPINVIDSQNISSDELEKYIQVGEASIKLGEYAVVTMAGGQGTRLGHNGPKGTFLLDVIPPKSIFEILCDKFKIARQKYGVIIPWYIMTSNQNNNETIEFFEKNEYFGYPKEYIKFFKQGELPMVDESGKILMEEKGKFKEGPDGNGGIFEALNRNGIINEINDKNIKWIYVGGVDNVLANMIDVVLLGATIVNGYDISSKSVQKNAPQEKAGVFCKKNGKVSVVNYTEISEEMDNQKDSSGSLVYGDMNILSHLFSINALNKIKDTKLEYHVDHKKADYINENGQKVIANEPNAYKFETYMFDCLEMFSDMLVLRTKRENEFAPIKNKEGLDSPQTAKELYLKNI